MRPNTFSLPPADIRCQCKNNFSGFFGGKIDPDFNADILFDKLGITPDWDKLNYYFLLNELFKTK